METPNQKRHPVLVVTRDDVIPVLNNVDVGPVTSTVRDIPTCIEVGAERGSITTGWLPSTTSLQFQWQC